MVELEEMVIEAKARAEEIIKTGQQHAAIVIAITPDTVNVIGFDAIDKNLFVPFLRHVLLQMNAYAYLFITEAWMAKTGSGSNLTKWLLSGEIGIADLPPDDKSEEIMITVVENGKSFCVWSASIKYTIDDQRYIGEWKKMEGPSLGGRMVLKEW